MALDDARKCGGKSRRLSNSRTAAQPMAAAGSLDQLSFEAEGFKTVVAVTSERAHLSRDGPEETSDEPPWELGERLRTAPAVRRWALLPA